ncbi:MAG: GspE/PulE family protein [Verrucomicrobiales bacterium]
MYTNEDYILELLQESGLVTAEDAAEVKGQSNPVTVLVEAGKVSEDNVAQTVAVSASMNYVDLDQLQIDPAVVDALSSEVALRYRVAPVGFDGDRLMVVVSDPFDMETLDSLPYVVEHEFDPVHGKISKINELLRDFYGDTTGQEVVVAGAADSGGDDDGEGGVHVLDSGGGDTGAGDAPIISLVSQILMEAFKNKASDIHLEPLEKSLRVRYRMDGVLHEVDNHPRKLLSAIISRIKIMTGTMSIAEKRMPQDARIQARIGDKEMDLRVSTIPTNHGESVVMRILDKSSMQLGLPQLGFFSDDQENFENLIKLPDGILLVTGPTGSGKTTTLYACLNHINKPDRKIITVEDPVEYQLSGINQVMVKEEIGMTFEAALRSILRQAPNIIMIGEIRDLETASIAINASLTGHLVFSTLHTNDAPGAVARLADIGVKRFLIASAVRSIMAQRLVRQLCDDCKEPAELSKKELSIMNIEGSQTIDAQIMGPTGCPKCRNSGYRGRKGIFEIFNIDDEVRHMINEDLTTPELRRRARELGMRTMREDGVRKVLSGLTSASEVIRVTMSDSD